MAYPTKSQGSARSSPSVAQKSNQVHEKYYAKTTDVKFAPRYEKETVKRTHKETSLNLDTCEHKKECG